MKRKLMIIAAAIMLVGGYAVYTTVENSILIQNVLANGTDDSDEGDGGVTVTGCKPYKNAICYVIYEGQILDKVRNKYK